jgi:D-alanyl-D-alanine carboxypeptidase
VLIVLAAIAAVLVIAYWQRRGIANIARNWNDLSDGAELARQLKTTDDLLEYIAEHRDRVSLVAYRAGDEANGIYLEPDRPRPLAATMSLMLLCEYAGMVQSGALNPREAVAIPAWEHYWLPGTDGNAHEHTFVQVRESQYIEHGQVQLQDIVYGLIRYGDNASADYLMERFGRERLATLPARLGMPNEEVPRPTSGTFLTWQSSRTTGSASERLARLTKLSPAAYADEVWKLTDELRTSPQLEAAEKKYLAANGVTLRLSEQAAFARALGVHGTARGYAALMLKIKRGELPGSSAMQAELEWPTRNPATRERFDSLGTKAGSVPSILTSVTYAKPRGTDELRVVALFFEGLPIAVWLRMAETFVQQDFETKLLAEPAFFAKVRARLGDTTRSVPAR